MDFTYYGAKTQEEFQETITRRILATMLGVHFTKEQAERIKRKVDLLTCYV